MVDATTTTRYAVNPITIRNFSALCWLSGRDFYEHMGGAVPVALAMNAVGAHPIESWLSAEALAACGVTTSCAGSATSTGHDTGSAGLAVPDVPDVPDAPNSKIYETTIVPMHPFTFGTMLWDQGEQDLNCNRVGV